MNKYIRLICIINFCAGLLLPTRQFPRLLAQCRFLLCQKAIPKTGFLDNCLSSTAPGTVEIYFANDFQQHIQRWLRGVGATKTTCEQHREQQQQLWQHKFLLPIKKCISQGGQVAGGNCGGVQRCCFKYHHRLSGAKQASNCAEGFPCQVRHHKEVQELLHVLTGCATGRPWQGFWVLSIQDGPTQQHCKGHNFTRLYQQQYVRHQLLQQQRQRQQFPGRKLTHRTRWASAETRRRRTLSRGAVTQSK